jgi:hypothetical protein
MTTTNITSTDPKIAATERLYARLRRPRPDWAQRRRCTEYRTRRLIHQLEQLGHTVTLEPATRGTGLRPELRPRGP